MLLMLLTRLWTTYAALMLELACCVVHALLVQVDIRYCRASTGSWVPVFRIGLLDTVLRGFFGSLAGCGRVTHVTEDVPQASVRCPFSCANPVHPDRGVFAVQTAPSTHHSTRSWPPHYGGPRLGTPRHHDDVTAPLPSDFLTSQGELTTLTLLL